MTIRIVGGGTFPGTVGFVTATVPLAVLTIEGSGLEVDLRFRFLKHLLAGFIPNEASTSWWSVEWADLVSADFGRRSVILRTKDRRTGRFVTVTRRRLMPLIEELRRRGIYVTPVKTTLWRFVKSR